MPGAQYMLRCYLPCCLSPHIQIKIVLFFPLFIKRTHTHCENVRLRQYLIERSRFHNQVNLLITFFLAAMGLSRGMQNFHCIMQDLLLLRMDSIWGTCAQQLWHPGFIAPFLVSQPGFEPSSPAVKGRFLTTGPTREVTVIIFEKFNEIYLIIP